MSISIPRDVLMRSAFEVAYAGDLGLLSSREVIRFVPDPLGRGWSNENDITLQVTTEQMQPGSPILFRFDGMPIIGKNNSATFLSRSLKETLQIEKYSFAIGDSLVDQILEANDKAR